MPTPTAAQLEANTTRDNLIIRKKRISIELANLNNTASVEYKDGLLREMRAIDVELADPTLDLLPGETTAPIQVMHVGVT